MFIASGNTVNQPISCFLSCFFPKFSCLKMKHAITFIAVFPRLSLLFIHVFIFKCVFFLNLFGFCFIPLECVFFLELFMKQILQQN